MSSAAPNAVLTSVRWDTSSYLIMVVQNILDGTPSKIPADYTGTLENGMIYLADINYSLLDSDTAEKVKMQWRMRQQALKTVLNMYFVVHFIIKVEKSL